MPSWDGCGPVGLGPGVGGRGLGPCQQPETEDIDFYEDEDERMLLASNGSVICQNWESIWRAFVKNSRFKTRFRKYTSTADECDLYVTTKYPLTPVRFDISYSYFGDRAEFQIVAGSEELTSDELDDLLRDAFPGLGLKRQASTIDEIVLTVGVYNETQFLKALGKVAWGAANRIVQWLDYGNQKKVGSRNNLPGRKTASILRDYAYFRR